MNQWEVFVMDMKRAGRGQGYRDQHPHPQPRHAQVHLQARARAGVEHLDKFPDQLQVRMGRGQLSPAKFSIKVIEEIRRLPPQYS
jgi:phenylphosphate carboxylase gamma subunit